jgi:hypothetical protein
MIWLTWRQFRSQGIVAGVAIAAVAVALAVTGPHLAALYTSNGLNTCASSCGAHATSFFNAVDGTATEIIFYGGIVLLYVAPAIIGLFWGAPLVTRELEAGTFRVAWNQSVTRSRWVAMKLGLIGLAAMATVGLISLMTGWWASPLYAAARQSGSNELSIDRLAPALFGANGIAPIGYAAFGFALGVTIGVLVRRTLPAMAITIAIFAAVQILWPGFVRPHLIPAVTATRPLADVTIGGEGVTDNNHLFLQIASINSLPGAWITAADPVTATGQRAAMVPSACASMTSTFVPCLASHGVRIALTYQPPSRYWAFQGLETGIFLALAGGLGGACYWRIRRLS